jgi:type III pantothenate kinase
VAPEAAYEVAPEAAQWLLIGNSRWHWASQDQEGWRSWHAPPGLAGSSLADGRLAGWAAVGPIPDQVGLDGRARIGLADIPLQAMPPWLGVDRALVGWRAWQLSGSPVLVADAGTALSLTRVDAGGRFVGGRLMAGAALQLRALGEGTAQLPQARNHHGMPDGPWPLAPGLWPIETEVAMASGVLWGLAAAVAIAAQQVWAEQPDCQIWLTGGDGAQLEPLLAGWLGSAPFLGSRSGLAGSLKRAPNLALEALAALRPDRGR